MFFKIPRCFDSHLHLMATGQVASGLDLSNLKSATEVQNLQPTSLHFSGEWLLGFGWDQNKWQEAQFPTRFDLDQFFPEIPVAFTRADGHALWVNSKALQLASVRSNGVLIDHEMIPVQKQIPDFTYEHKKQFLLAGIQIMNQAGFTHIRDMSGDRDQIQILRNLDSRGKLTLYVEQNIFLDSIESLSEVIEFTLRQKKIDSPHLRIAAVKYFYDGALGSEGALLSQYYSGRKHNGLRLSSENEIEKIVSECWKAGLPVAVHTIGDQASLEVVRAVWKVWQTGLRGVLHLEHAELLQPQTIEQMKHMQVIVHMQPCHWLSDRHWLEAKIAGLKQYAFQWRKLAENKIPIFWGSDTPVEKPSVQNNMKALFLSSEAGVPAYPLDPTYPHIFPDPEWGQNCWTEFSDGKVQAVQFDGQPLKLEFSRN